MRTFVVLSFLLCSMLDAAAQPVGSAFTYQGELRDQSQPADGFYDMEFRIFAQESGGNAIAPEVTWNDLQVVGGVFTVNLDFGFSPFDGQALWLEIRVRRAGSTGFTILEPRQEMTASPYALQAVMVGVDAVDSAGIINNSVTASDIASDAVRAEEIAAGAVGSSEIAADAVGSSEIAPRSVDATAIALPLSLVAEVQANPDPAVGAALAVRNTADGLGVENAAPYGIVGQTSYSGGTQSPMYLPPAGVRGDAPDAGSTGVGVIGTSGDISGISFGFHGGLMGVGRTRGISGYSGTGLGIYATSTSSTGVWGNTSRSDQNYGLYTNDNLFASNATLNSSNAVVLNTGKTAVSPGEVVVFQGVEVGADGIPTATVGRSMGKAGVRPAGIVVSRFDPAALPSDRVHGEAAQGDVTPEGAAAPGEYLLIATQGPVLVKLSASYKGLAAGQAVGMDPETGMTKSMEDGSPGMTPLGTALQDLPPGQSGEIFVFIH